MSRPSDLPKLSTVGARVRWWREHRKISRKEFAKLIGSSPTGLSDLELGRTRAGKKLHLIAAKLGISAEYLETDQGDPEAADIPANREITPWPFPAIPRSKVDRLNKIERSYAETKLLEALAEIEAARKKTG